MLADPQGSADHTLGTTALDGTNIPYVNEYVYLGQLISFDDSMEREVQRRITLAWRAFWSLKFVLLDKSLSRTLRIESLETCIYPVVLYGSQTWSLTSRQRRMLQLCQRKMVRKILGVSLKNRIANETLLQLAPTTDIAHLATSTKWRWGGHVARMADDRWTYRTTMWDPRAGKRLRGRPRRRWADIFREHAGRQWTRVARGRDEWRVLGNNLNRAQD